MCWAFAMSLIPEAGLQSVLIPGAIVDRFFGLFTGANSSNPVNLNIVTVVFVVWFPESKWSR